MTTLILTLIIIALLIVLVFTPVYRNEIHEHENPYILKVENNISDNKPKNKAMLFGHNMWLLTTNFGSDKPIKVTTAQSNVSYIQMLQQSAYQPFSVRNTRISFNKEDLKNIEDLIITLTSCNANGKSISIPLTIGKYYNEAKASDSLIENEFGGISFDFKFMMKIDGNTYLSFETNMKQITFMFFYNTSVFVKSNYFNILFKGAGKRISDSKKYSRFDLLKIWQR